MRRSITLCAAPLSFLTLCLLGAGVASADTIVGPSSWTVVGGNDTLWGIQFTALRGSTLTGFDYTHRDNSNPVNGNNGLTGTVSLVDISNSNTTVYTQNYGGFPTPGVISYTGLNIALVSGDQYQLVATSTVAQGANDEVYQYISSNSPVIAYPDADADISVTQGVFNNNPGFQESFGWGAFSNITTSAVPEPGAYALFASLGLTGAALLRRRKRAR